MPSKLVPGKKESTKAKIVSTMANQVREYNLSKMFVKEDKQFAMLTINAMGW